MANPLGRAALPAMLLLASALLAGPTSTPAEAHTPVPGVQWAPESCYAAAPVTLGCSTGQHAWDGASLNFGFGMGPGLPPSPLYVGTLESTLVHPAGNKVYRCSFNMGVSQGCTVTSPPWGPGPHAFHHVCASYDLGTTNRGGQGPWACTIWHT